MRLLLAQSARPLWEWDWVMTHLDAIVLRGLQHLRLTAFAIGIGALVSMALSLASLRWRRLYAPILAVGGILYSIPSLALFGLLVPLFHISVTTAVIALASYTLLILVRNTVTGVDGIPPEVREAALGMGYTRRRLLWAVELPLALPAIIAGVRIATVTVVGLVTVTALLGLGGFGAFILDGFRRSILFPTEIIAGCVLSVLLAVVLDALLLLAERLVTPWARRTAG